MAQKRKPDQTKLAEAALELADRVGWDALTFKDIAKRAKVKEQDVAAQFSDIWDILKWVLKKLETDVTRSVGDALGDDWRDNLSELLMMRFELAQPHRAAFVSLAGSFARHPRVAPRFARSFFGTLDRLLRQAGFPKKLCQPLILPGFAALYLSLVDAWTRDETRDLSKTMAAIDRRLDLFEKALGLCAPLAEMKPPPFRSRHKAS